MTDNTAGGPSIIFNRYHEKHKTTIHRVEMEKQGKVSKVCKNVVGYDANALHPWAIMQPMPAGNYIIMHDGRLMMILRYKVVLGWKTNGWNGRPINVVSIFVTNTTILKSELVIWTDFVQKCIQYSSCMVSI